MKISAELRTSDFGTRGSRRLLRAGRIPAVVYGAVEPMHISIDARDFNYNKKAYRKDEELFVVVDGKEISVKIQSIQEDILKNIINHVDFLAK